MLSLFHMTWIVGLWKIAHKIETPMILLNQVRSVVASRPLYTLQGVVGGKALPVPGGPSHRSLSGFRTRSLCLDQQKEKPSVLSSIMHIWPVDSCPELNVILGATISTDKPLCSRRGQVYGTDCTLCSHVTDTEKVESIVILGFRTDKKLTSRVGWMYLSLSYTWQQEGLILPQVGRDLGEPVAEGRSF